MFAVDTVDDLSRAIIDIATHRLIDLALLFDRFALDNGEITLTGESVMELTTELHLRRFASRQHHHA